jgi:hypothetical protein
MPVSGSYAAGTSVLIRWWAAGVQTGSTINLCYTTSSDWSGVENWISVGAITAFNGWTNWYWDTTGVPPGTYYIGGYVWDGGTATWYHATTTFIIT